MPEKSFQVLIFILQIAISNVDSTNVDLSNSYLNYLVNTYE